MSKQTTSLPKGYSQLEVKATLRHRGQVNDSVSVTFEIEPTEDAMTRYLDWLHKITSEQTTPPLCQTV